MKTKTDNSTKIKVKEIYFQPQFSPHPYFLLQDGRTFYGRIDKDSLGEISIIYGTREEHIQRYDHRKAMELERKVDFNDRQAIIEDRAMKISINGLIGTSIVIGIAVLGLLIKVFSH